VAVQLEDDVVAPHPLPGGLKELILSKSFCGSVAELPQTLCSFEGVIGYANVVAVQSVLRRLSGGLQRLQLSYCFRRRSYGQCEYLAADLPTLSYLTFVHLENIEWSTEWPSSLQELCLSSCKVSDQLQLPVTLRKLKLRRCSSSSDSNVNISVALNEGLQQLHIESWYSVDLSSELPSTLTQCCETAVDHH
jgi:hypothetical protein